jgi:hypothetical protein
MLAAARWFRPNRRAVITPATGWTAPQYPDWLKRTLSSCLVKERVERRWAQPGARCPRPGREPADTRLGDAVDRDYGAARPSAHLRTPGPW